MLKKAKELTKQELKAKDALHIACAKHANCAYFITTDDQIINKTGIIDGIEVLNPVDMLKILED